MIAFFAAIGLPRKFAIGLVALATFALTIPSMPVQAKEVTKSAATTTAKKYKNKKQQVRKKATRAHKTHRRVASSRTRKAQARYRTAPGELGLMSQAALVIDQDSGETLLSKNSDKEMPIASLTKLMTALVVLDSKLPLDQYLKISTEDVDREKNTHSRLTVGTELTRDQMLLLALMSSENRAAVALSRNYPGGRVAFIAKMNAKAKALGMHSSHFADAAGLSPNSVSTARDLHRLVSAAYAQPLIRAYSVQEEETVRVGRRMQTFINSNRLVRNGGDWDIGLQKTGFTNEAGRCLVMQVTLEGRRVAMIFLDSFGKLTRYADASRVRQQIERKAYASPSLSTVSATASP